LAGAAASSKQRQRLHSFAAEFHLGRSLRF
jgi:hypothetical protein